MFGRQPSSSRHNAKWQGPQRRQKSSASCIFAPLRENLQGFTPSPEEEKIRNRFCKDGMLFHVRAQTNEDRRARQAIDSPQRPTSAPRGAAMLRRDFLARLAAVT